MRPYERKSTEVEMAIQRERDEAITEEEEKLGPFYSLEEVKEAQAKEFGERFETEPKINVWQGGFIATYNLGKMTVDYLVELQESCQQRFLMAAHDVNAVEAELRLRRLPEE